jgi:uncharacterized membrane protein
MGMEKKPLQDNVAGALAYFALPAIVFLAIDPYSKKPFVRFHAWQALLLWGAWLALSCGLGFMASLIHLLWAPTQTLLQICEVTALVAAVFCAAKAYNNETFGLPIAGDIAKQQAGS